MARQLERWAPLGGIIFVVLMVVGTTFVADVPDPDAPSSNSPTTLPTAATTPATSSAPTCGWWEHSRFSGS
jgi:hypothetical protein